MLVHQLLAMCLAGDGIRWDEAWAQLSRVPDFKGIRQAEFERLVRWMLRDRSLVKIAGRLAMGPKAEHRFGRRNFMELYAVFSSPRTYTVQTLGGQPLGSLSQAFVDRLVDGVSCFLLGGRAWAVIRVGHDDRRIHVEPAPRGRQPTWGGFLPQFLGFDVCQRILQVLTSDQAYPYLDPSAVTALSEHRDALRDVLEPNSGGIELLDGELHWWTFAGGRINATLRYALNAVDADWKVIPDNYLIKLRGDGVDLRRFEAALSQLRTVEFWENDKLWGEVAESLPSYRLSKFQPLMPPWVEREVVASYLLDVAGAWRWLSGSDDGLRRVPEGVWAPTRDDRERVARVEAEPSTLSTGLSRPAAGGGDR